MALKLHGVLKINTRAVLLAGFCLTPALPLWKNAIQTRGPEQPLHTLVYKTTAELSTSNHLL